MTGLWSGVFLTTLAVVAICGCGNKEGFTQQANTQYFLQDYNPEFLDVLFVLDDRSPMNRAQANIAAEASKFFTRLDALTTSDYRMGLVTADMQFAQGALQPKASPVILKKGVGTVADRAGTLSSLISSTLNLHTGAQDQGFAAALSALNGSFVPRANVPLVLVFISDSDDHSNVPSGDSVTYYSQKFLAAKNADATLLRVYSVDYAPTGKRCATQPPDSEIDRSDYTKSYFNLATALGGSTADLCGSFSDNIDLGGLKFKTLPRRFLLSKEPIASSIQVSVFDKTQSYPNITWNYDASTNNIVFDSAPPQGATIQVTFNLQ